ncbi:unnamed protein product [Adineta steineri]|uniref:DDE-1 domain-containing protein n=1 Tax=Adineta steineri TaxID=433720 RepID=A0A815V1G9_9BILA|nr:unnamed protein product [Adineta steineri]CAF4177847.1 unnamed protein product [Adineta steineri]
MVRNYKRKTVAKYTEADMQKALDAVRSKELKPLDAAKNNNNIPLATLYARLSGTRGNGPRGAKTILSSEEESFLVQTIEIFEKWQLPLLQNNVIDIARAYMLELGKKINQTAPLTDWFASFMHRHHDLKLTKCENLEKTRSVSCTPLIIQRWFETLHGVLSKHKLLDRPNAIFNVDESGFFNDPGRRSVVVRRSTKRVISSQSGSGKEMTTVLICTSASGKLLPPYIVYAGTHLWNTWICKNSFAGTRYNTSLSGWVEEHIFFDWLSQHFIPYVEDIAKPVLLIFDGHKAHISTRIIKLAMDHHIELLCLPPHSTTVLQPLDVVTLAKIKTAWRKLLTAHNTQTNSQKIDKKKFSYLIGNLWRSHILPSHCSSGFSRAGIYPYDPRAVSREKLFVPPTSSSSDPQSDSTDDIALVNQPISRLTRSLSCAEFSIDALTATTTPLQRSSLMLSSTTNDCLSMPNISSDLTLCSSLNNSYDLPSSTTQPNISQNRPLISSILDEVNQTLYPQQTDHCDNNISPVDSNLTKNAQRNSLDILTTVIADFLTPTVTADTEKRKHRVDRPYGESLTTIEALSKVQEKENKSRKRKKPVVVKETKKAPAKRQDSQHVSI